MQSEFRIMALTPVGVPDPAIAIAAARAGETGLLDLEHVRDEAASRGALKSLDRFARGQWGVKLDASDPDFAHGIVTTLPQSCRIVLLAQCTSQGCEDIAHAARARNLSVLIEVFSAQDCERAGLLGADAIVVKGNEAGGFVSEETAFILLQHASQWTDLPVWVHGGIGLHTAAGCAAVGAAGCVLDSQLLLTRESPLPETERDWIASLDGSETVCLGEGAGQALRVYARPGSKTVEEVRGQLGRRDLVRRHIGWDSAEKLRPIGQDAAFGRIFAERFRTTGSAIEALRRSVTEHLHAAASLQPLSEASALAHSHGTRFPIVQGPMTRVSDTAEFANAVAENGGLPFLALAMMRGPEVSRLLEATRQLLGDKPWGAGILGFVPPELREEQLDVVRRIKPRFALIAGGRPDQAKALEHDGIASYLHVPSPALLRSYIEEGGARRFVFEGRECGGHVGPRSSFVLWESMIEVLLAVVPAAELPQCHVLFAAGIHDARSAAMVAAIGAKLAERGAAIGVLLGTAYLFTEEALHGGAIVPEFQKKALECSGTVLLESGPGHAIRCVDTPYRSFFENQKQRLRAQGRSAEETRAELEQINVGRLRIASKGITRAAAEDGSGSKFISLSGDEQHAEGMYMIGQVAALRHETCTIADLHRDVSVGSSRLLEQFSAGAPNIQIGEPERPSEIAIVGMGCMFPKAPNLQKYWEDILDKVDAITEVPPDRWDASAYLNADPAAPDGIVSKAGGFLDEIQFDPVRYGIPPAALRSIDPLQLLTLEAVRMALEDAGYEKGGFSGERASVIVGAGGGIADLGQQYAFRSALGMFGISAGEEVLNRLPQWTEDSFPGLLVNVAAGRVANRFDLGGVNFTVDAACASALAAVYVGIRELESGSSDLVLVGGADTMQNPFAYTCFSKTQALSLKGRCTPFDESADGIAISEGVAAVVLKRLADAEKAGDRIYAVIRSTRGSSDGRSRGLTAPRPEGQMLALRRAYAASGISPASVELIEAHGTGTVAGDQAELQSLRAVFDAAGAGRQSCAIGSVKSLIGHTKCTAGLAGLIKVALALHHKVLPPTGGIRKPNPKVRFDESPFYPNAELRPWIHGTQNEPRRAGVSAFGFGGTNFHAVVEEYQGEFRPAMSAAPRAHFPTELVVFSGSDSSNLLARMRPLEDALARGAAPELQSIAFTAWLASRDRIAGEPWRAAFVAANATDLRVMLAEARAKIETGAREWHDPRGGWVRSDPVTQDGGVVALFPGQGAQYPDMLRDLAAYFPVVRESFAEADRILAGGSRAPLSSMIFPPPRFAPEEEKRAQKALTATDVAQPALGAAAIGAFRLLREFGLDVKQLAGHSYGEYSALCAAGAIDAETLLRLSRARGAAILEAAAGDLGTMLSCEATFEDVVALVEGVSDVWISNRNAPRQIVLSGTRTAIARIEAAASARGVRVQALNVACAFHSPLVGAARSRFAETLSNVLFHAPEIPVYSNASGERYPADASAIAAILSEHLARPVEFQREIEQMYRDGARVFVECGPRAVLTALVGNILGEQPHVAVSIDAPGRNGITHLERLLAELWVAGATVNLDAIFAGRSPRRVQFEELRAPAAPPSTVWLVNGGRVRPAIADARKAPTHRHPGPAAPKRIAPAPPPDTTAFVAAPPENSEPVMLRFQSLMQQFLDTQRQVMTAYLGGAGAATVSSPSLIAAEPAEAREQPPETAMLTEPAETSNPQANEAPTDMTATLLKLVSERTGYPIEMLGLDLNIEGDLGIDSIKKIEIVSAFRKMVGGPERPRRETMDMLSAVKTLRGIVEILSGAAQGAATAPPESIPPPQESEPMHRGDEEIPRSVLREVEIPQAENGGGLSGTYLITEDGLGVAQAVREMLLERGADAIVMGRDQLRNGCEPTAVLQEVCPPGTVLAGVLSLAPLESSQPFGDLTLDEWKDSSDRSVRRHFLVTQAAAPFLARDARVFTAGYAGDEYPVHGALVGFQRTLAVEWPGRLVKALEFAHGETARKIAARIVGELATNGTDVVVRYTDGRRLGLRPGLIPLCDGPEPPPIDSDSIVLITGGARGITAAIAGDVAARYRPRVIVLFGRTPEPGEEPETTRNLSSPRELKAALVASLDGRKPAEIEVEYKRLLREREVRATLETLRGLGLKVEYMSVDVRDAAAFGAAIDSLYDAHGRLDCVIHGAGIIDDKLVQEKAVASFDSVFETKVNSAFVLARHLRPESLRTLVFFSSVAGTFGSRGQIDYTAANAVVNRLARLLDREWPSRVVALNWGPWSGAGMVTPEVARQFEERGIRLVQPKAGIAAFDRELRSGRKGDSEVILGWGPWNANPSDLREEIEVSFAQAGA